ncbi:hypothetical protein ACFFV7_53240 [Nonomuraea spiralis]|uniref:Uncharacterized protein n=1 Tax=Nonomuraea spiralis TaxID=46182 RepID=A0ABV5J1H9_9ACTN|nr:hypothetical protein [Nonomuraea spiralis]
MDESLRVREKGVAEADDPCAWAAAAGGTASKTPRSPTFTDTHLLAFRLRLYDDAGTAKVTTLARDAPRGVGGQARSVASMTRRAAEM